MASTNKAKKASKEKKSNQSMKKIYQDLLGSLVESMTSKPGFQILDILLDKSNVNEFLIAKKLNLTINQTRNTLYRLSDNGIVSFTRKKDKKKGWYTYFWTLDTLKALEFSENLVLEGIKNLQSQKKNRENKRFYICRTCNIEVTEETALINNFTCPECGNVYELNENHGLIKEIEVKINNYNKELVEIRKILEIERKKVEKKIEGKNRREKEKRKVLKREKAEAKKKEKAKEIKKKNKSKKKK